MARKPITGKPGKTTVSGKAPVEAPALPAKAPLNIFRPEAEAPPHLDPTVVRLLERVENHRWHFARNAMRKVEGDESGYLVTPPAGTTPAGTARQPTSPKRQMEMHARQALRLAAELTRHCAGWAVDFTIHEAPSPRTGMADLLCLIPTDTAPLAEALRQLDGGEQPPLLTAPKKHGKPKTTKAARDLQMAALLFVAFVTSKRTMTHDDAVAEVVNAFAVDERTFQRWRKDLQAARPVELRREIANARAAGEHYLALIYPKRKLSAQETEILKKYNADYGLEKLKALGRQYRRTIKNDR